MFESRRLAFGAEAERYERARPSYPVEAARFMLGAAPLRVVDLGAGTGKFTRILASLGHDVIAVEPDAGMRAQLAASTPGVEAIEGSGEAIPLEAGTVDGVVAAQSFHWFDNDESRAEIARVLRPGGVFSPMWNVRDDSVHWVRELSDAVLQGDRGSGGYSVRFDFGPLFGPGERAEFRHVETHSGSSFVDFMRSRSRYLVASEEERQRLDSAVEAVTSRLPDVFELPYVTVAYRAKRL